MSDAVREVVEGTQPQGVDEEINYTIDTTLAGGTPTSPVLLIFDKSDEHRDVTSEVTSGVVSVLDNIIVLPQIEDLVLGHFYRCEVAFTTGENRLEHHFFIKAEL